MNKLDFLTQTQLFFIKVARKLTGLNFYMSFSRGGVDLLIRILLKDVKNGFYIDAGSNDPIALSNTFLLYLEGWTGINIDLNESLINKSRRIRKNDINICAAISNEKKETVIHEFNSNAVSTIDEVSAQTLLKNFQLKGTRKVFTKTLNSILEDNNINRKIDLLSIDVEGMDFQVLQSIDLVKYEPKLVVIETWNFDYRLIGENEIITYMEKHEYYFYGYVALNMFFFHKDYIKQAKHLNSVSKICI